MLWCFHACLCSTSMSCMTALHECANARMRGANARMQAGKAEFLSCTQEKPGSGAATRKAEFATSLAQLSTAHDHVAFLIKMMNIDKTRHGSVLSEKRLLDQQALCARVRFESSSKFGRYWYKMHAVSRHLLRPLSTLHGPIVTQVVSRHCCTTYSWRRKEVLDHTRSCSISNKLMLLL